MCIIPPPSDPSHWPARVGHLQAALQAGLGMLRQGQPGMAQRALEDALKLETAADESFHAHLTRALEGLRR